MKKLILCLGFLLPLITGCFDMKEVSDELYAIIMAVDKEGDGVKVSVVVPEYSSKEEYITNVYSVESSDMTKALSMLETKKSRKISLLHLKAVVFSEELAREGLFKHALVIQRHLETTNAMGIVISAGSGEELITHISENTSGDIASEIELMLLSPRYTPSNPTVLFEEFYNNMTSVYKSASAPMGNTGESIISGTALFNGDKMTGSLNERETAFFMLANGGKNIVSLDFETEKGKVWVDLKCKKRKISVKNSIHLTLFLEGEMEYSPHMSDMKDKIEKDIKKEIIGVLRRAANLDCDILGAKGYDARNFSFIKDWEKHKVDFENIIVDLKLELLQNVNG